MIGLCRYLLLQGYEPDQITILTAYVGKSPLYLICNRDWVIELLLIDVFALYKLKLYTVVCIPR